MSGEKNSAVVEVLTAEVRVLMVGSRQVTLSVAAQLDIVHPQYIRPFGRFRPRETHGEIDVIGIGVNDGTLVKSWIRGRRPYGGYPISFARYDKVRQLEELPAEIQEIYDEWRGLPLIVLAGLR